MVRRVAQRIVTGLNRNRNIDRKTIPVFVMVFIPVKYIYPTRTDILHRTTLVLGLVWAIMIFDTRFLYPAQPQRSIVLSLCYHAYYCLLSCFAMYKKHGETAAPGMV